MNPIKYWKIKTITINSSTNTPEKILKHKLYYFGEIKPQKNLKNIKSIKITFSNPGEKRKKLEIKTKNKKTQEFINNIIKKIFELNKNKKSKIKFILSEEKNNFKMRIKSTNKIYEFSLSDGTNQENKLTTEDVKKENLDQLENIEKELNKLEIGASSNIDYFNQ